MSNVISAMSQSLLNLGEGPFVAEKIFFICLQSISFQRYLHLSRNVVVESSENGQFLGPMF